MGFGNVPGQGASQSPTQVRDALQTLTGSNRLDASAVKSLPSGGGGLPAWQLKTANYTAVAGDRIRAQLSGLNLTITCPLNPNIGDEIEIQRLDTTANSLIIDPNGKPFKSQSNKDGLFNNGNIGLTERISYVDNTIGWLPQHDRLTYQTHVNTGISDPLFANVVFLMIPIGADNSTVFSDSSTYTQTITTIGDTKILSNKAIFDGMGDRLTVPASPNLAMGSSNFCFETEIETSQTTSFAAFMTRGSAGFGAGSVSFLISPAGKLAIYWADFSTSVPLFTSTTSINDGVLRHVAWDRSGSTHRLFVAGVLEATVTTGVAMPDCLGILAIGDDLNFGGRNYNGKNKVVRITSASRYTANFTPPSSYPTS